MRFPLPVLLPALIVVKLAAQDLSLFQSLKYRSIGPYRGGRVTTVAGVDSLPGTYYYGATGGGIWKTTDNGANWDSLSDGQPFGTGSVGAIEVAPSDPNIVYAGMGESPIRGNFSYGDGMYKSTDAGHTWKRIGLEATRQIARVRVNPKNPDIVYVAALGHVWAPNEERGIYKTVDGGKTWKQIFTRGPKAGAIELVFDPANANVHLGRFLGSLSQALDPRIGRPRQRYLQDHRRCRYLDRYDAIRRPPKRHDRQRVPHHLSRESRTHLGYD